MHTDSVRRHRLLNYFLLVFVLSIPFWLISSILGNRLPIPINLPISAFLFLIPVIAASILVYRQQGSYGVKGFLKRAFDYRRTRNKLWYAPALLISPLVYLLAYAIMRMTGSPLPDPIEVPFLLTPAFFAAFFVGAICEELGWSGYALDPMQNRWGALAAGILLGFVWQMWHIIGVIQADNPVDWIVWHALYSIALRVVMVWIYNNAGRSVFAAILMHTTDNVSWSLFPNYGSHYDPLVTFIIMAVIAAVVTLLWGPRTLSRFRYANAGR